MCIFLSCTGNTSLLSLLVLFSHSATPLFIPRKISYQGTPAVSLASWVCNCLALPRCRFHTMSVLIEDADWLLCYLPCDKNALIYECCSSASLCLI